MHDPVTGQGLEDKILNRAMYLASLPNIEGYIDSGYKFEAKLHTFGFLASDVQTETYMAGDREKVITCSVCLDDLKVGWTSVPCDYIYSITVELVPGWKVIELILIADIDYKR